MWQWKMHDLLIMLFQDTGKSELWALHKTRTARIRRLHCIDECLLVLKFILHMLMFRMVLEAVDLAVGISDWGSDAGCPVSHHCLV